MELAAVRLVDRSVGVARASPRLDSVTAIVKTFERPAILARLLESLRRLFPGLRLIVADDSRRPVAVPDAEVVTLPFDSGVSAGRQAALERVETEYTWLLDDDFVVYAGTRLGKVLAALERYPRIDLVGGPVIKLPLWLKRRSAPTGLFPTEAEPLLPPGRRFGDLEICDKVPNFFVARTDRLKLVGWTPELKRLDHSDFFTRARGVLVTAYWDRFRCFHAQTPFDAAYQAHREDLASDWQVLSRRYADSRSPRRSLYSPAYRYGRREA